MAFHQPRCASSLAHDRFPARRGGIDSIPLVSPSVVMASLAFHLSPLLSLFLSRSRDRPGQSGQERKRSGRAQVGRGREKEMGQTNLVAPESVDWPRDRFADPPALDCQLDPV